MKGEHLRAAGIAVRNLVLGGNLAGLAFRSPRRMVQYASDALFLKHALSGERTFN